MTESAAAESAPAPEGSAGVVVRFDAEAARVARFPRTAWIPASIARRVAFAATTTTLGVAGGITLGLALVEGRLLTLVGFGPIGPRPAVVLCTRGETDGFAFAVEEVVASGLFDDARGEDVIALAGEPIDRLDLDAVIARLEAAFWIADATPERLSLVPRSRKP